MKYKKEGTKKLSALIMRLVSVHSTILILCTLFISCGFFAYNQEQRITESEKSLAHTVADYLDGDQLVQYAQTLKKDKEYNTIESKLSQLKSNFTDCKFMYVIVPDTDSDQAVYVFDIFTKEEIKDGAAKAELGEEETYSKLYSGKNSYVLNGEESNQLSLNFFTDYGSLATYYVPVLGSDGSVKAVVGIDYSITKFIKTFGWLWINILVFVAILSFFLVRLEIKHLNEQLVSSIKRISERANEFAHSAHDGNSSQYHLDVPENSENEIEQLAQSINTMMNDVDSYIMSIKLITSERERIATELELAEQIQQSCLPSIFPAFPDRREFELYALMNPAKEVGGDFYDFFFVDDDHLALVIADVSGKGIPAALFMMISKVLVKNVTQSMLHPKDVLQAVNDELCENNVTEMFVTVWLGIIEISTGKLVAANAGHECPAICRKDGQFDLFREKHGLVLAGMEGVLYQEYEIQLNPGDTLFLYTDGVTEATNKDFQLYGYERMLRSLNTDPHTDTVSLLKNLRKDISDFVGGADQFDDITMVSFKLK